MESSGHTSGEGFPHRTYKLVELVGTSTESYEDAIRQALHDARRTLRGLAWFEVTELRGAVRGEAVEFQAKLKVGFRVLSEAGS